MDLHPIHLNNFRESDSPYAIGGRLGSPALPIFAHVATPVAEILGYSVEATTTGPVCGECMDCRRRNGWNDDGIVIRHASAEHVRECWEIARHCEWQAEVEAPLAAAGWL